VTTPVAPAPDRLPGESRVAWRARVAALAAPPMPRSRARKARAKPGQVEQALARVADGDERRAREHERDYVAPKRVDKVGQVERLLRTGSIDRAQADAAERLQADYERSGFSPRMVANYEGGSGGGSCGVGLGPTAAEYGRAMRAVGIVLSPVLAWVVLEDRPASEFAVSRGMQRSDGIALLRAALDALAVHYRMKTAAAVWGEASPPWTVGLGTAEADGGVTA
jgi:hypothetical protein